jgi:hypothetical protein
MNMRWVHSDLKHIHRSFGYIEGVRREMSADELTRLITTTQGRTLAEHALCGPDRAMLYRLALGQRRIAGYAIEKSLPAAVGAFVHWLLNESGWTITERERPNERLPIEARHVCILFKRFSSFGEDKTRAYVRATPRIHLLQGEEESRSSELTGASRHPHSLRKVRDHHQLVLTGTRVEAEEASRRPGHTTEIDPRLPAEEAPTQDSLEGRTTLERFRLVARRRDVR